MCSTKPFLLHTRVPSSATALLSRFHLRWCRIRVFSTFWKCPCLQLFRATIRGGWSFRPFKLSTDSSNKQPSSIRTPARWRRARSPPHMVCLVFPSAVDAVPRVLNASSSCFCRKTNTQLYVLWTPFLSCNQHVLINLLSVNGFFCLADKRDAWNLTLIAASFLFWRRDSAVMRYSVLNV